MKIEKATILDAETIADINIKVWKTTYKNIISKASLTKRENQRESIIERICTLIKTNTYLIAKIDDTIVGFILYGSLRDTSNLDNKKTGEIYAIYILDTHQRKGIGKNLMAHAIKDLISKEYKDLLIWGLKNNPYTQFYEKLGGKKMSTREIKIFEDILIENSYYFEDIKSII
jgi:ribosomal protein S18 acetylase RimI-like enzyme